MFRGETWANEIFYIQNVVSERISDGEMEGK